MPSLLTLQEWAVSGAIPMHRYADRIRDVLLLTLFVSAVAVAQSPTPRLLPPARTTSPLVGAASFAHGLSLEGSYASGNNGSEFPSEVELWNASRQHDNNQDRPRPGPNVPEPMVFDLVRPLGARQGELEVNVLGLVPFRRVQTRTPQFDFITGADQGKRPSFEWAPEIEYVIVDDFAVEFELPLADGRLEAFKLAAQYTFGTAFDEQYIHGLQGIVFIDRTNGAVTPTLLYIGALRFDRVYSTLFMLGFNHEFGGDNPLSPTQMLMNFTLFAEINDKWTLALEANYVSDLDGTAGLLFMPEVYWNFTEKASIQCGIGTRAQEGSIIGEGAFRIIYEF